MMEQNGRDFVGARSCLHNRNWTPLHFSFTVGSCVHFLPKSIRRKNSGFWITGWKSVLVHNVLDEFRSHESYS